MNKEFLEICHDIRNLLMKCKGSEGKGIVVVKSSPKEMYVTKSGCDILRQYIHTHPLLTIIVNSILEFTSVHGEGSKRIYIFVVDLLERLSKDGDDKFKTVIHIQRIIDILSRYMATTIKPPGNVSDSEIEEKCGQLVRSTLQSRLGHNPAQCLANLWDFFVKTVMKENKNKHTSAANFKTIILNLDHLIHQEYNKPVSESRCISGIILDTHFWFGIDQLWSKKEPVGMVLLTDSSLLFEQPEVTVSLDPVDILTWNSSYLRHCNNIVTRLKSTGVDMVVCSRALPDLLRQQLVAGGMACVEQLGTHGEMTSLARLLGIVGWCEDERPTKANIALVKVAKMAIGDKAVLQIIPTGESDSRNHSSPDFNLHTLIISGPNKPVVNQYCACLLGAVKACRLFWSLPKTSNYDNVDLHNGETAFSREYSSNSSLNSLQLAYQYNDITEYLSSLKKSIEKDVVYLLKILVNVMHPKAYKDSSSKSLVTAVGQTEEQSFRGNYSFCEPLMLQWEIMLTTLNIVFQIMRIERVCYISKRISSIKSLKRNRSKITKINSTESDDSTDFSESEEEDI